MSILGPFLDAIFCLTLLIVAKCCFNNTFLLDKKSMWMLVCCTLIRMLSVLLQNYLPWTDDQAYNLVWLWLVFIVLRGGKGWLKRTLSMLEVFVTLGMGLIGLCGFLVLIVMPSLPEETSSDYASVVATVFSGIILIYVYFALYKKGIYFCFKGWERVILILFALCIFTFFSLTLVEVSDTGNIYMESWIKYVFVISMGIFYLVFLGLILKGRVTDYYKKGQVYQQEWMERELRYFTDYKRTEEETKRFRHDMINNLSCIEVLMQEGKTEEAKLYLETLLGNVKALSPKVVSGDEMLDCIISSKWDAMREAEILFTIDGVLDRGLCWQPIDICTVFANALDNAVEACMQVEKGRKIALTCKRTRNFYYIELKNTMCGDIDLESLEMTKFTTKKHKEFHGYGLDSMRRTLAKYDSEMQMEKKDGMFILKMMIPT